MAQPFYDPEESELSDLDALYKATLAHKLRGSTGRWSDALAPLDVVANSMRRREIEGRKAELLQKQQEQLAAAMPDATPEVRQLMGSAHTRPAALEMYKEQRRLAQQQKMYKEYLAGREGQATIPAPKFGDSDFAQSPEQRALPQTVKTGSRFSRMNPDELIGALQDPNPYNAGEAKVQMEHRVPKEVDPGRMYLQADGRYGPMSGSIKALEDAANAKDAGQIEWATDPNDPNKQTPMLRGAIRGALSAGGGGSLPLSLGAAQNNLNSGGGVGAPPSIPPEILNRKNPNAPFVATQAPGQPVQMQTLPSRPSAQGSAWGQQMAQEMPKIENSYYAANEVLRILPELKGALSKAPGFWAGGEKGTLALRAGDALGMVDPETMKAFQILNNAEASLMGPFARDANLGAAQGFTDKDREFIQKRLPSNSKTQTENEQGLKDIEEYFTKKRLESELRLRQFNPQWSSARNPTSPGAGSPPVPGKQSALDLTGVGAGSGVGIEPAPRPIDEGNFLERMLKGGERGIGMAGVGMAQALPESVTRMLGMQKPSFQDVRTIRESGPTTGAGKVGEFAGEVAANPATYVPGATLPRAVASGLASGYTAPAGSAQEQRGNTAISGVLGGAGNLVSRFIPRTEVSTAAQAAARQGFEDIPLVQSQVAGKTGTWEAEGIAKRQAQALTAQLMEGTGSAAKKAIRPEINAQESILRGQYERLFPNTRPMRMDTSDASQLAGAFSPYKEIIKAPDFVERAPGVAQLFNFAERTAQRGKPRVIPADVVQSALQDVAHIENPRMQKVLRDEIRTYVNKNLTSAEVEALDKLNRQWGNLSDLKRMHTKDGLVIPSSVKGIRGSDADRAAEFITQFGVQNPKPWDSAIRRGELWGTAGAVGSAVAGLPYGAVMAAPLAKHVIDRSSGAAQGALGTSRVLNADPATRQLIEMLRSGVQLGPRELAEYGRQ